MSWIRRIFGAGNNKSTTPWYAAKSNKKHLRQIVVQFPAGSEVAPQIGNLLPPGHHAGFMNSPWAAITLLMSPKNPRPLIFVRAEGFVDQFRGCPLRIAFSFYRMNAGGLFTSFVHVKCPSVEARTGNPAVFENPQNLNHDDGRKLVEALISQQTLEVCFTASGENGPCTGYFGMATPLLEECRVALKNEWNQLLAYHNGIPAERRNFQDCVGQMERETPLDENPILDQ